MTALKNSAKNYIHYCYGAKMVIGQHLAKQVIGNINLWDSIWCLLPKNIEANFSVIS
jgi:hypothetical protein